MAFFFLKVNIYNSSYAVEETFKKLKQVSYAQDCFIWAKQKKNAFV